MQNTNEIDHDSQICLRAALRAGVALLALAVASRRLRAAAVSASASAWAARMAFRSADGRERRWPCRRHRLGAGVGSVGVGIGR